MRLKESFIVHENKDEQIIVDAAGTFAGMVRNNKTAAFIVKCLKHDTTMEAIINSLYEKYDAPLEEIQQDVNNIIQKLKSIGAIDE